MLALDVKRSALLLLVAFQLSAINYQLSTFSGYRVDPLPLLGAELKFLRRYVLLKMCERRCARDWQHDRRFLQQPGERELHHADIVTLGFCFQWIIRLAQRRVPTAANRRPRNESHL